MDTMAYKQLPRMMGGRTFRGAPVLVGGLGEVQQEAFALLRNPDVQTHRRIQVHKVVVQVGFGLVDAVLPLGDLRPQVLLGLPPHLLEHLQYRVLTVAVHQLHQPLGADAPHGAGLGVVIAEEQFGGAGVGPDEVLGLLDDLMAAHVLDGGNLHALAEEVAGIGGAAAGG